METIKQLGRAAAILVTGAVVMAIGGALAYAACLLAGLPEPVGQYVADGTVGVMFLGLLLPTVMISARGEMP